MDFQPTGLGYTIFKERYARHENETWEQACRRVAEHVAQAEENGKYEKYSERFYHELVVNRFSPGGRIWYGAGRPKAQLLNCFVLPSQDSREGWGDVLKGVIVISGLGGGVGINCSPVRPRGAEIKGTGGKATGSVSLMEMIDKVGDVLVAGGGRRLALMLCLDVNHPDLPEFLDTKLDLTRLNNANISVVLNMPTDEFVRKIREDENIEFEFGGRQWGTAISARALWDRIVINAWNSGEPGVLNSYFANQQNNIFYHKPLISTNPCGEIFLEEFGCCDLGALVLPRFVKDGEMNWDQLDETVRLSVRFLDDVLTVNHYPTIEIKENSEQVRRIGLGVMGLHTMLLELGLKYSSPEAQQFVDKLFDFIKNTAYDTSINLAIEKGPFPVFRPEFLQSGFVKTLKRGIRNKIKEYGIRNCALLTIAPTGTTGLMSDVSTGIEPYVAAAYWRHYKGVDDQMRQIMHKELVVRPEWEKYGSLCEGIADLTPRDHFEMQKITQKHIDNAVSKTINVPPDLTPEELSEIWLEYLPYCKGTTLYRSGSREFEPIVPIPVAEIPEAIESYVERATMTWDEHERSFVAHALEVECPNGVCDIPSAV